VFGADYPTPDGTCIRDYIHVTDLARAHVLALRHLLAGGESMALNLGTGRGLSIRNITDGIAALSGKSVPVTWADRRPGDPPALVADASAAKRLLGFQTERSDLETILRDAAPSFGLTSFRA
jgi:UDP-arabinose 4-epimerase